LSPALWGLAEQRIRHETAEPIQFCATELLEALTEIRNRRDQEIAEDHELAWEHATLPSALTA
jgi:hypothetical protein